MKPRHETQCRGFMLFQHTSTLFQHTTHTVSERFHKRYTHFNCIKTMHTKPQHPNNTPTPKQHQKTTKTKLYTQHQTNPNTQHPNIFLTTTTPPQKCINMHTKCINMHKPHKTGTQQCIKMHTTAKPDQQKRCTENSVHGCPALHSPSSWPWAVDPLLRFVGFVLGFC